MRTKEKDTRNVDLEKVLADFQRLSPEEKEKVIDWIKALLSAP